MSTTAMIFFIIIGADLFSFFIALSQMPIKLAQMLQTSGLSPMVVIWMIIASYIVLGALMDEMSMILLTIPVFFPVVIALGFDPIWFGVIVVLVIQIGMLTPTVGISVVVISGIAKDVPVVEIYKGVTPFLMAQIILAIILSIWPQIATIIPNSVF